MHKQRSLLPLLLLIFLDSFGYFLVIPVLLRLIYQPEFGLLPNATLAQQNLVMGITVALGFVAMIIAAPYVGKCSDKFGRKKTFLVCLIISLLGFLIPILGILKKSMSLIIFGRFLAGVGSASQPVAQAAVADIAQGKQKALYLSFIAFAMTVALLLGPLAGGYLSDASLASWFTPSTPYWIGVLVVVGNIILLQVLFTETASLKENQQELSLVEIVFGIVPAIKRYKIGKLLLAMFLLEFGWSQYYNSIMQFLLQKFHYTTTQASNFTSYLGLLMCIGLLILYPILIRFFTIKNSLKVGVVLVTLGLLGCAFTPIVLWQWIFVMPVAIFVGISYVGILALLSDKVDSQMQGWIMGYAMTALAMAWFITSFISGWLLNINLTLPIIVATGALLITSMLLIYYDKTACDE